MSIHKSTLELTIKGRNFAERSVKTDPQCIVYSKTICEKKYLEIGRTEVIRGSRNPNWSIKVPIAYRFNELQALKLEVWDYDICADNELLGDIEVLLGAIVAAKVQVIKKRLKLKTEEGREMVTGELWLSTDEVTASKQTVDLQFQAKSLARKDFLGSSDPYLMISKENIDGSWTQVYKSEVIHNTLDPVWPQFSIRIEDLCDSDFHKLLKIECYDWDRHTNDDYMGSLATSLHILSTHFPNKNVFELSNDLNNKKYADVRSKRKSMRNNFGFLLLKKLEVKQNATFFDYIRSGTQIHFMVGIDFTQESQWFHHIDKNYEMTNNIEFVIRSLGQIIQCYDYQGLYGAYGFGAKLLPTRELSHNFNININSILPYCDGINEIISSYRSVLRAIEPDGPRHFASIINHVLQLTKNFQDGKHYFVLTIITCGSNSDNADTLEAIVKASAMPLSIIFVGIGNSNFTTLKRLSGDSTCSRGWRTYRDNVQFVLLRNYLNQESKYEEIERKFAQHLLETIPLQMLQFMESRNYSPK